METLELKHLAPYLPYRLKIRNKSLKGETLGMYEMEVENDNNHGILNVLNGVNQIPLLHPLDRLTEPIDFDDGNVSFAAGLKLYCKADVEYCQSMPLGCDYETIQKLYEWHFDVFGLIEKGLAEPIKPNP